MKFKKSELSKKFTSIVLASIMVMSVLLTGASAAYDEEENYMSIMITACATGDYAMGLAASQSRNEKIAATESEYIPIDFDELWLISKIMYAEAGSEWLSDEWKMCVGEVVLNRVASPEFPNTVAEVLAQPGQYYGSSSRYFTNLLPSERCVTLAVRLLEGERVLNNSAAVFQANFRQGSGVCREFHDKYLGATYFCYSSRMGLYEA